MVENPIPEKEVYADNNATTPVDPRVKEAIQPFLEEKYGNPNSMHSRGREAREAVEEARAKIASLINGEKEEIVFTSCATEANNHALKGAAFSKKGKHIVTTKIEHDCVLNASNWLEEQGFDVTYLEPDKNGFVSPEQVEEAVRDDTILASVMLANNEIGTIEPIEEIGELLEKKDILFHTDAAQAVGKIPVDVKKLKVDMLTLNAHKMYGPKGIGGLWVKDNVKIDSLIHGGGQEKGRRSGTENVPYIVGFGKAAKIAESSLKSDRKKLNKISGKLMELIPEKVDNVVVNGPEDVDRRLPGNTNFSFHGVEGESLVLRLDSKGIKASTGSACASESLEASHVLKAIGLDESLAHSSLRMSFGRFNSIEDVEKIREVLPGEVEKLREISSM
ncbi:MAG: cysteine desulfurase [Candidatus Nanohaloarchaeota archaeon QJJ-9]|nr:cysteine desulfurase [Candidatus Nanohaloarchaeota archaeon QJJ-9]